MNKILVTALSGAMAFAASIGIATANTITIAGGLGTIDCSTSCEAFTLGAPALGAEPNAMGILSISDAWFYDGQPASESAEADRLSILISGATGVFSGADGLKTIGNSGSMMFSSLAEYVMLKIGNDSVFIRNTSGGMLSVDFTSFAGAGSGLSHYTEFGEVPIPGAIWLMGIGLAGLGAARRKAKAI